MKLRRGGRLVRAGHRGPTPMRILAGILLIASAVVQVLLGGSYWLSAKYQQLAAEDKAGDISSVIKDLDVSDAELRRVHNESAKAKSGAVGRRPLVLGAALTGLAGLEIVAAFLILLRRAKVLVVGVALAGIAALGTAMVLEGFTTLAALAAGALAAALLLALLVKRRPRPAPVHTT